MGIRTKLPYAVADADVPRVLALGNFIHLVLHGFGLDAGLVVRAREFPAVTEEIRKTNLLLATYTHWRVADSMVVAHEGGIKLLLTEGVQEQIFSDRQFDHAAFALVVSATEARARIIVADRTAMPLEGRATLESTIEMASARGLQVSRLDECLRKIAPSGGSKTSIGVAIQLPRSGTSELAPLALPQHEELYPVRQPAPDDTTRIAGAVTDISVTEGLVQIDGTRWILADESQLLT